eukprot:TRINITY_DN22767_c0_g1_i1.p1 TRINITY_DN22767_c0_g1~~TRINITY_DN22767_c0_g1_i1.p1  ORF type:complete len:352 (+),score=107.89 TRINITY_DN22767_c0_g1_i1:40-1095(+)
MSQTAKPGRGKRRRDDEDDEQEFENPTQQADGSQSTKKRKEPVILPDSQERDKLVSDLMRYVLFSDLKRTPVTKAKINEKVLHEHKRATNMILSAAKEQFADIFGFDLVELPTKRSSKRVGAGSSGVFVLKNKLDKKETLRWDDASKKDSVLLMTVLGIIYLQPTKVIDEESLFIQLQRLGFLPGKEHRVFGQWEKELANMVSEQYLDRKLGEKLARLTQKKLNNYRIGPRTLVEIGQRNIIAFISHVYGLEAPDEKLLQQLELDEKGEELLDDDDDDSQADPASQAASSQAAPASQRASQLTPLGRAGRGADSPNMSQSHPARGRPRSESQPVRGRRVRWRVDASVCTRA